MGGGSVLSSNCQFHKGDNHSQCEHEGVCVSRVDPLGSHSSCLASPVRQGKEKVWQTTLSTSCSFTLVTLLSQCRQPHHLLGAVLQDFQPLQAAGSVLVEGWAAKAWSSNRSKLSLLEGWARV